MGRKLKEIDICEKCGKGLEDFPSRKVKESSGKEASR